ncbi:Sulfate transporter family domain containing protein [Lactarius tabidus]
MHTEKPTYTSCPQLDGEESATETICENYPLRTLPEPVEIEDYLRTTERSWSRSFTDGPICWNAVTRRVGMRRSLMRRAFRCRPLRVWSLVGLLGSSRLNVAPEAALSLLGRHVRALRADPHTSPSDPEAVALAVATAITVQVGFISFALGFFRLGFIDVVLSRALLRGFVAPVAFIILMSRTTNTDAWSHRARAHETTMEKLFFFVEHEFTESHRVTAIRRYKWITCVPEVLIVVIVSTILSDEFSWDEDGIAILGDVPIRTGGHFIRFPFHHHHLPYLRQTTSTAVMISIVGFLDSIVAAKQNAARFSYSISPNRELVALGAGNLAGAFVPGTLPAYGSITRSRINADSGARTQMASIACAVIILIATFFFLPWLYYLPKCVLGSIVCLVVYSLLAETPEDVVFYWKVEQTWVDMTLMSLAFILTITWSVQVGFTVSLIISLLLVTSKRAMRRPCKSSTSFSSLTDAFACFPSTPDSQRLQGREGRVFITYLRKEPHAMFERGGIAELLGEDAFYEDVSKAMRRLTGEKQG